MLFNSAAFVSLALLASRAQAGEEHSPEYNTHHDTAYQPVDSTETACESEDATNYVTTTYNVKTDYSTTTHLVEVTVPHHVNSTVTSIKTKVVESYVTECITTTLYYTDLVTNTDTAYVTDTLSDTVVITYKDSVTVTDTDSTTVTYTDTDLTTITNTGYITVTGTEHETVTETDTDTTTETVPTTTYTTETIFSTTYDPCPTTCSISVETVNLYFWPTDRPYTYPTTWVDESLDYTFTYPSVYMLIPTAVGTNTAGEPFGPATSDWILPLDLSQVSTIVGDTSTGATQQLTLSDLGTDCPKSVAPGAIATMAPDPRCNPILAAPEQVSSWAYPCNACGRFGLFDPPYAAPTLTGPLVLPTATTSTLEDAEPTATAVVPTQTDVTSAEETTVVVPSASDSETQAVEIPTETAATTTTTTPGVPSEATPVPLPSPTSVSVPEVGTESATSAQPIPTAGAADLGVAMGSLLSVFAVALLL